ncbi:MAG: type II toxin-antitoxin system VapC family toxin [Deltaproteobacteria bacterium]|nr:type II toxin-antitoxin system VapC family toxin [Deltaproteobacteria bacterium]
MIVADTNLVAYLVIDGERTEAARRVRMRDADWRLPPLWRSEFLNVLATSVRASVIDQDAALRAWEIALDLFGSCEAEPGGTEVLKTALRYGISAYDAQFARLAEHLGVTLVSGDKRLCGACASFAVSIEEFAGMASPKRSPSRRR